ncbi:hypothetical protein GCM10009758_07260 [Microbacterium hatanonis]
MVGGAAEAPRWTTSRRGRGDRADGAHNRNSNDRVGLAMWLSTNLQALGGAKAGWYIRRYVRQIRSERES